MKRNDGTGLAGLLLLAGLAILSGGCNEAIDDADESPNFLTVTSAEPANICVDGDGEPVDQDGDGTVDGTFFVDVPITFTISSTLKNANSASPFNDVVLTTIAITYTGSPAPSRNTGITIEVPAGGSADIGVIAVSANDISGSFGVGTRGTARFVFQGEDLSGEPASATASLPFESVNICQ